MSTANYVDNLTGSERQRMLAYGVAARYMRHLSSLIRANLAAGVSLSELPRIVETVRRNQPQWFRE